MSIKSAIDKLTGKSSKNIEDAISKIELGGKPAPKTTTLFDQTMAFAIGESIGGFNFAYVTPFDPTGWSEHLNDDITFAVDNKEYTKVSIATGETITVSVSDNNDNQIALCRIGNGIVPGVSGMTFGVALLNESEGDHHIVVKATEKEEETSNRFVVTLTGNSSSFVSDKTYSEIESAFNAGKLIYIYIQSRFEYIPLSQHVSHLESDEHFEFTHIDYDGLTNPILEIFSISQANTVSFVTAYLNVVSQS